MRDAAVIHHDINTNLSGSRRHGKAEGGETWGLPSMYCHLTHRINPITLASPRCWT